MIEIDGSEGEGGGQMLRTALGLSALTGRSFRLENIRARRDRPGLAPQHLMGVKGVAEICHAAVDGAMVGSTSLTFEPGIVEAGDYHFDVGTAGSITLVLQACMLACARTRSRSEFDIIGGTNVRMSPPSDYLEHVLFPLLRKIGYDIDVKTCARGFYPQGGGEMVVGMSMGERVLPLNLEERGNFRQISGVCFTQKLPDHIADRMASTARKTLVGHTPVRLVMDRRHGHSIGAGIFLAAEYENTVLASDALGEKGISSEKLGELAATSLVKEMGSGETLDPHAADQILPYLSLAVGPSSFLVRELTMHFMTQMDLVSKFLDVQIDTRSEDGVQRVSVVPNHT
ncbi:MAG TPA: RNA 3'-terminal phosphate cyclase [Methanomassiliicoccales archaeon]|jgi:RNA 3'-phosphate cyclase